MKFDYTARGPLPWAIVRTNEISLQWIASKLVFTRKYRSKDSLSSPIEYTFNSKPSIDEIAKQIHWGCCGWSAGTHQLQQLVEKVTEFYQT